MTSKIVREFIAVPHVPTPGKRSFAPKDAIFLHPLGGYDPNRDENPVVGHFGYPSPKPQLDVVRKRITTTEDRIVPGITPEVCVMEIEVTLGELRCGTFKRLRGLSFNFGGVKLPLKVFHFANQRGVSFDPPYFAGLHRLAEDDEVYVVGNPELLGKQIELDNRPVICLDFYDALIWHLSLCKTNGMSYIWPDGTVVDAY